MVVCVSVYKWNGVCACVQMVCVHVHVDVASLIIRPDKIFKRNWGKQ